MHLLSLSLHRVDHYYYEHVCGLQIFTPASPCAFLEVGRVIYLLAAARPHRSPSQISIGGCDNKIVKTCAYRRKPHGKVSLVVEQAKLLNLRNLHLSQGFQQKHHSSVPYILEVCAARGDRLKWLMTARRGEEERVERILRAGLGFAERRRQNFCRRSPQIRAISIGSQRGNHL